MYADDSSESTAFETTYETLDDPPENPTIQFSLRADLKNVKDAYTYVVRVSEITESDDVIFEPAN